MTSGVGAEFLPLKKGTQGGRDPFGLTTEKQNPGRKGNKGKASARAASLYLFARGLGKTTTLIRRKE